jgi:branched-chain amino acid transport system permease protein
MSRAVGVLALCLILVALPWLLSTAWLDVINLALMAAIGAVALDLLLGHAGLVSIGSAAFIAIGALGTAELAVYLHLPFLLSVLGGGILAGIVAIPVSLPSFRIRGLYLAATTLALQYIVVYAMHRVEIAQLGLGGAGYVLPKATIGGLELVDIKAWYVFLLIVLLIVVWFTQSLLRRKPGRAWHAIREHEDIAAISGVSIRAYKVWAFVVSSLLTGLCGGLLAYYAVVVDYQTYTLNLAISYLAMVIVGGMGSTYGAIVGAVLITSLNRLTQEVTDALGLGGADHAVRASLIQAAAVGCAIVLVILVEPKGISAIARRIRAFLTAQAATRSRATRTSA